MVLNSLVYYNILRYIQTHQGIILPYSFEKLRNSIKIKESVGGLTTVFLDNPEAEDTTVAFSVNSGYFLEDRAGVPEGVAQLVARSIIDQAIIEGKDFIHRKSEYSAIDTTFFMKTRNKDIEEGVQLLWETIKNFNWKESEEVAIDQIDRE